MWLNIEVGNDVLGRLSSEVQGLVRGQPRAPFRSNFCVELVIPGGLDDCLRVRNAIKDALEAEPLEVQGRAVYAHLERSPQQKQRIRMLAISWNALGIVGLDTTNRFYSQLMSFNSAKPSHSKQGYEEIPSD